MRTLTLPQSIRLSAQVLLALGALAGAQALGAEPLGHESGSQSGFGGAFDFGPAVARQPSGKRVGLPVPRPGLDNESEIQGLVSVPGPDGKPQTYRFASTAGPGPQIDGKTAKRIPIRKFGGPTRLKEIEDEATARNLENEFESFFSE